jgi:hypothetical protein
MTRLANNLQGLQLQGSTGHSMTHITASLQGGLFCILSNPGLYAYNLSCPLLACMPCVCIMNPPPALS